MIEVLAWPVAAVLVVLLLRSNISAVIKSVNECRKTKPVLFIVSLLILPFFVPVVYWLNRFLWVQFWGYSEPNQIQLASTLIITLVTGGVLAPLFGIASKRIRDAGAKFFTGYNDEK